MPRKCALSTRFRGAASALKAASKSNHRGSCFSLQRASRAREFNREETFISTLTRHEAVVYCKSGVKQDGTLMAREMTIYWGAGAYAGRARRCASAATRAGRIAFLR